MPPMTKVTMKPIVHSIGTLEADAAAIHGEQPVEDLHARRHRDDHRHDAEEGVDVGARAHGEEVVQPDGEGEHRDRHRRVDERHVAEQPLAEKVATTSE